MPYKHQNLLDEFKLTNCPGSNLQQIEIKAYRWTHAPIENPWNFLPNILYARVRNRPLRALENDDICANCNLSFFDNAEIAHDKLSNIKKSLEKKHKDLLAPFYTHIAEGIIDKPDGEATLTRNAHFGFYEYENSDFTKKFSITREV